MSLTGHILPSIYVDLIEESAFSGLLVANDWPERNSVGADSSGAFQLDVMSTNGSFVDQANTDIYVEGVQAYDGGTSSWINGFTGTATQRHIVSALLADWRMEESGVASWTAGNSATLTKQPGAPDGHGLQVLRVAFNGVANPNANQPSTAYTGVKYRITAKARGDGTAIPRILFGAGVVWTGTSSSAWQSVSFEVVSAATGAIALESQIGAAGYTEWDNVQVEILGPDWHFEGQAPAAWASEQVITIRVVSQDLGGPVDTLDFSYDFTVEDLVVPTILSVIARDHSTLRITFSEAMTAVSASGVGDALNPSGYALEFIPASDRQAAVWATVSAVAAVSSSVFDLTTDMPLTFGKTYQIQASVKDVSGNQISPINDLATFTSWTPPGWDRVYCPEFYDDYFSEDMHRRDEGDLERLCSVWQDTIEYMVYDCYRFREVYDLDLATSDWLDAMLADLGNPFDFDLTDDQKRQLIEMLVGVYNLKGTEPGILALADFFTDINITDVRPYSEDSWIMGEDLLGLDTVLGPSTQAALYSFEVLVDTALTATQLNELERLVDYIKVAHEHAYIVQPAAPAHIDHWEMGYSLLGVQTWLH